MAKACGGSADDPQLPGLALEESTGPTISRTRRLIDVESHREVFTWIQERLAEVGVLSGKTLSIDATTLEATAAMRSIAAMSRLDRRRRRKGSNDEWTSPAVPTRRSPR
jgi:transposase